MWMITLCCTGSHYRNASDRQAPASVVAISVFVQIDPEEIEQEGVTRVVRQLHSHVQRH
jgi:hypothetical protein